MLAWRYVSQPRPDIEHYLIEQAQYWTSSLA